jgi:hypothetical protein
MKRVFSILLLVVVGAALLSCGSQSTSPPGANVTGSWNAVITGNGLTTPSYTFGMSFTKDTTLINGTEIPYTGGTQYNPGCINYGSLTATGNTNGGSLITLIVTDPTTNSSFTISASADATVSQLNGTFNATFGANGSKAACPQTSGTVQFTRQ